MKTFLRISTLLVIVLSVACGQTPSSIPQDVPSGPGAWIDAPLDGSTIPLAAYDVVSHASDPGGMSEFELSVNGQVVSTDPVGGDQAGKTIAHISQPWLPPAPGTYLLAVRAANGNSEYGPSAFAQVIVEGEPAGPVIPEASDACIWTAAVNVFVRTGPGASTYPEITAVEAGKTFPVVGMSQDQQFWAVEVQQGLVGYVPMAERFSHVSGNCDVPALQDPLPPPPAETDEPEPEETAPQCSDGIDNDSDGKADYNAAAGVGDRQCTSLDDNDEAIR